MGKRNKSNREKKVPLGAENLNAASECDGNKEFPNCNIKASLSNQKKESGLQPSSRNKVPFVKSSVDAKPNSKVSASPNKAVKSEKTSKSIFENERQAQIDCTSAVRPKYKVQNVNWQRQAEISSHEYEDNFEVNRYSAVADLPEASFYQMFSDQCKVKRSEQTSNLGRLKMKESFISTVNQYKNDKASFLITYRRWLPKRKNTLEKLRSLCSQVHDDALKYNQSQAAFKQLSCSSRELKQETDNQAVDFFTSLTAFVSDAVSGIASFAEACNVDSYQVKFQEIMDCDAEITKDLYAARSQCMARYRGVEEVMREFHSDTLTSTVCKISNTLEVDKHWEIMKHAYKKDDMQTLLNEVNYFFSNASSADVLGKVGDTVQRYVSDNPAALDACKSTGKAVYGAFNTFGERNDKRSNLLKNTNSLANSYLMWDDKQEVERLQSIISEDTYQNKLELRIESAIESLESEMEEMKDLYFQLSMYLNDNSD